MMMMIMMMIIIICFSYIAPNTSYTVTDKSANRIFCQSLNCVMILHITVYILLSLGSILVSCLFTNAHMPIQPKCQVPSCTPAGGMFHKDPLWNLTWT